MSNQDRIIIVGTGPVGCTAALILVQQGIPVLPKTHKKEYMLENIDLFDWELTEEEMASLAAHVGKGITLPAG
ncbi:MAG: hypothetical protein OSB82_22115, partial [Alphaproteobacteria bacterium]|nr:hypothetical protein [Alphaproteobacteria bacterium]